MKELLIFIVSSVQEFREACRGLSPSLEMLKRVHRWIKVQLVWNCPETESHILVDGGA